MYFVKKLHLTLCVPIGQGKHVQHALIHRHMRLSLQSLRTDIHRSVGREHGTEQHAKSIFFAPRAPRCTVRQSGLQGLMAGSVWVDVLRDLKLEAAAAKAPTLHRNGSAPVGDCCRVGSQRVRRIARCGCVSTHGTASMAYYAVALGGMGVWPIGSMPTQHALGNRPE